MEFDVGYLSEDVFTAPEGHCAMPTRHKHKFIIFLLFNNELIELFGLHLLLETGNFQFLL